MSSRKNNMYCTKCGQNNSDDINFCTSCGEKITSYKTQKTKSNFPVKDVKPFGVKQIVVLIVAIVVIVYFVYSSLDDNVIEQNNSALNKYEAGDYVGAIKDLEQAKDDAVEGVNKLNSLKNLAYLSATEGDSDKALEYFYEALDYAGEGSFDYYLVSGEIAYLEGKPNSALLSYNKAYDIDPDDFQINNALSLFYLDIEDFYPSYANYPKALIHAKKSYENYSEALVDSLATENLAIAYLFNEDYSSAIKYFLKVPTKQSHTYFFMGITYAGLGDSENMEYYLQKSVDGGFMTWDEIYEFLGY